MAGFAEMEEEDRVALFRQGSFEVIMARYTPLLTSDGMFTPDMTVLIPRYSYSIYAPRFKSSFIALFLSFYFISWLAAWHSGRMSVSGRRTFPVLRSTCS